MVQPESSAPASALDIRRIDASMESSLAAFFQGIKRAGDDRFFHPHPFDDRTAHQIAVQTGRDLYFGASRPAARDLIGYGMLRGWDAGYEVPSLGIIIAGEARGQGLARPLMLFMHDAARRRGCSRIRLKVYPDNAVAVALYRGLGYVFAAEEQGQLVGMVEL